MSLRIEGKRHAVIAAGQGNQTPGMGLEIARAFPTAKAVWRRADEAMQPYIGQRLSRLVWTGSTEDLKPTEVSQPATIADALARMKAFQNSNQLGEAEWHSGNSLGLVVALVTSGALGIRGAAMLGRGRSEAFRYAIDNSPATTMLALNGVEPDIIGEVTERYNLVVCLENPGRQTVLGGLVENVRTAKIALTERGIGNDKATSLEGIVDAAFHSPWMEPGVSIYREVVDSLPIRTPDGRLVAGSTASVLETPADIREALVLQVTHTERFAAAIKLMVEREVNTMTELNGQPRLSAMLRREFPGSFTRKVAVAGRNGAEILLGFRWFAPEALPAIAGGAGETREEIREFYINWVADRTGMSVEELNEGMHFVDDATLDSADLMALRAEVRNKFGRNVPDEEAKSNITIGLAVEATYKMLNS